MKFVNFKLTTSQASDLNTVLTESLQSLVLQESMIKDAIEKHLMDGEASTVTQEQYENLLKYLKDIAPKRMIIAEITTQLADNTFEAVFPEQPTIIESTVIPSEIKKEKSAKELRKERYEWVDSVVDDIAGSFGSLD